MALRLGSPPGLARLRLQWHSARSQFLRHSRAWREEWATRRIETLSWWQRSGAVWMTNWNLRERAHRRQLARQLVQLTSFTDKYEDLVDLLCWAAKEGVHADQAARYAELRMWMQSHYGLLRPRLRVLLNTPDNIYDPFECLFAPQDLAEVINDLSAIENVMHTRAILDAYRETLQ